MITVEPYEFEGEHFVKLTSATGATMDITEAEWRKLTEDRRPVLHVQPMPDAEHAELVPAETELTAQALGRIADNVVAKPGDVS